MPQYLTEDELQPEYIDESELATETQYVDESELEGGTPDVSRVEALASAASQAITFGFADELWGGIKAGIDSLDDQEKQSFTELYKKSRDEQRQIYAEALRKYPGQTITTEMLVGLAMPVPGAAALRAAKGAKAIGEAAKMGAKVGAIEGLGRTTKEDVSEMAQDVAMYTVLGGVGGGVLATAGKGISKLRKPKAAAESQVRLGRDIADKTATRMEANSEQIDNLSNIIINQKIKDVNRSVKGFAAFKEQASSLSAQEIKALKSVERDKEFVKLYEQFKVGPEDRESFKAFYGYTKEAQNYAVWATKTKPITKLSSALSNKRMKKVKTEYEKISRAGQVNPESYKIFKSSQYATEEAAIQMQKVREGVWHGFKDPTKGFLTKNMMDLRYVLSRIDDSAGTELGILGDDLYRANNALTSYQARWSTLADDAIKARRKAGMTPEEIRDALESPALLQKLSPDKKDAVSKYTAVLGGVRRQANRDGMDIAKIDYYVPYASKNMLELIPEMKKWGSQVGVDKVNKKLSMLWNKTSGAEEKAAIGRLRSEHKDLYDYGRSLEHITGEKISDIGDLKRLTKQLDDVARFKNSSSLEVSAANARKGGIHPRLRETDADKLLFSYIDNVGRGLHMATPLRALEAQADTLRVLGMKDASKYIDEFVGHMAGVPSVSAKKLAEFKYKFNTTIDEQLANVPWLRDTAKQVPQVMTRVVQSIYPNLLGMNPRAILRNYTQPFMMTGTELGGAYGFKTAMGAVRRVMAMQLKAKTGYFQVAKKELARRNLAPVNFKGENVNALQAGMRDGVPGVLSRVMDAQEKFAMGLYSHSDFQNRMITLEMAKQVTKDLFAKHAVAKKFIENLEPAYKTRLQRILKRGASPEQVEDLIAQYLITKTQFAYGKVGMNRFGRHAGPLVSMFTKWPVAVGSEITETMQRRGVEGARHLGQKYMFPLIALSAISAQLDLEESPRGKELITRQGLSYWSPILAVKKPQELMIPPALSTAGELIGTGFDILQGRDNLGRELEKRTARTLRTYMPGAVWYNTYKRINPIIFNKED